MDTASWIKPQRCSTGTWLWIEKHLPCLLYWKTKLLKTIKYLISTLSPHRFSELVSEVTRWCFCAPPQLFWIREALQELNLSIVINSTFQGKGSAGSNRAYSLLREANRKWPKSTYPRANLWLGAWWIFRLTLSNSYCLDLAKTEDNCQQGGSQC